MSELYTCVVNCAVCGAELDRATSIPEEHRLPVSMAAQIEQRCKEEKHNDLAELELVFDELGHVKQVQANRAVVIQWFRESDDGLVFLELLDARKTG